MLKKIFTKEMIGNAAVTFVVVVGAIVVANKFILPRLNGGNGNGATASTTTTTPADETA